MNGISLPDIMKFSSGDPVKTAEDWHRRRLELIDILSENEYGFSPPAPGKVNGEIIAKDERIIAGKAVQYTVRISFDTPRGEFSFPLVLTVPKTTEKLPLILLLNFREAIPDKYYPQEEIVDRRYACAMLYYQDITSDDGDFSTGISGMYPGMREKKNGWGKISMWAWAASRAMDWLMTTGFADMSRVTVLGHSRLGKTALWCAAQDERFFAAASNDAGCAGDSVARISATKQGAEHIADICKNIPYWFCENYYAYADNEDKLPFDQHFLLAAIAPRRVCIGSSEDDVWAYPPAQYASCLAASEPYRLFGLKGLVGTEELPPVGTSLNDGEIAYHIRAGLHFLSRTDWNAYMDYLDNHR